MRHEGTVAGHRATFIEVTSTVRTATEDIGVEIGVRRRSCLVFSLGFAVAINLSSSDDTALHDEADFTRVIDSVRVGGPTGRRWSGGDSITSIFIGLSRGF